MARRRPPVLERRIATATQYCQHFAVTVGTEPPNGIGVCPACRHLPIWRHPLCPTEQRNRGLAPIRCRRLRLSTVPRHTVGTMIELPRACFVAGQIAKHADFFSFGTNDLAQSALGFSRDDVEATFVPPTSTARSSTATHSKRSTNPLSADSCASPPRTGATPIRISNSASAANTAVSRPQSTFSTAPDSTTCPARPIAFPSLGSPPPKRRSETRACRLDTDSRNDNCSLTTLGAVKRPPLDPNGGCTTAAGSPAARSSAGRRTRDHRAVSSFVLEFSRAHWRLDRVPGVPAPTQHDTTVGVTRGRD